MYYLDYVMSKLDKTPMESGLQKNGDIILEEKGIKLIMPAALMLKGWYDLSFIIDINGERDYDCMDCMDYYKGHSREIRDYDGFVETQNEFGSAQKFKSMVNKSGWNKNLDEFDRIFMKLQRELFRQVSEVRVANGESAYMPKESVKNYLNIEAEQNRRFEECFHIKQMELTDELYEKAFSKGKPSKKPYKAFERAALELDVDAEAFEFDDFEYPAYKVDGKLYDYVMEELPELRGAWRGGLSERLKKYKKVIFVFEERLYEEEDWALEVRAIKIK